MTIPIRKHYIQLEHLASADSSANIYANVIIDDIKSIAINDKSRLPKSINNKNGNNSIYNTSYFFQYSNSNYLKLSEFAKNNNAECIPVCARLEEELSKVSKEDREMYLSSLNTTLSGLDKITFSAYTILGLRTFFTSGTDEVRAWTFKDGTTAKECAGIIHSDFEKFFLKAEVFNYDDIMKYKTELALKEAGKILTVGKDYLVKDGDILYIKSAAVKK